MRVILRRLCVLTCTQNQNDDVHDNKIVGPGLLSRGGWQYKAGLGPLTERTKPN